MKSRVFISCGQSDITNERETAHNIAEKLAADGFEPYIAVQEQSLAGLKDNIFRQLENSDYFVFVDFKRDQLAGQDECRGSVFCHQELALASYLDLPVIGLREKGVIQLDGIARFIQGNFKEFIDRHLLPAVIADMARDCKWNPNSRNCLTLVREEGQFTPARQRSNNGLCHFFQIGVKNNSQRKCARNCFVYLERLVDVNDGKQLETINVELKWEAYTMPSATILPGQTRRFDAFYVYQNDPKTLQFNPFSDYEFAIRPVKGSDKYEMSFAVVSDTFETVRGKFVASVGDKVEDAKLE